VDVGRLSLRGGAQIASGTFGAGAGGTVTVKASESIDIAGAGSSISTDTWGSGVGGNIHLTARQIRLQDGGTISAGSRGTGRAGNILLDVVERFESQGGAVTTESERAGGGSIELKAGKWVLLQDSAITTSVQGGGGNAGNITISGPQFVILNRSQIIANAFEGMGGNIRIVADHFLKSADSQVSASSSLGIDGTVEISAPEVDLSGGLEALPVHFFDAAALFRERCAVRGGRASLVAVGRGGVPPSPDGFLPSFQLAHAGCSLVAGDATD
jgi:hypothetical protein